MFVTFISEFENSQNSFSCGPLWSILVCKVPQFWANLPIRTAHYTFLENRHPEVTKNLYYVLFPEGSQIKVSVYGLISKRSPCLSKTGNLCCSQLTSTRTFISQQTKRKFKIYHKVNCKSEYVIYLMECALCNKQYIEKQRLRLTLD